MKKVTIKEIKRFLKTLEENRYRKLVHADARRIAWFVNNSLSEDYDTMPESMRKKWVKAEYKKERYMAKKFLESKKQNESVKLREGKGTEIELNWQGLKGKDGEIGKFIVSSRVADKLENNFKGHIVVDMWDDNVKGKVSSYNDVVKAIKKTKYGKIAFKESMKQNESVKLREGKKVVKAKTVKNTRYQNQRQVAQELIKKLKKKGWKVPQYLSDESTLEKMVINAYEKARKNWDSSKGDTVIFSVSDNKDFNDKNFSWKNESVETQIRQLVKETIKDLMEGKRIQFIIPMRDRKKTAQVLKKTRLKVGQDYDFGAGKGSTFILDIDDSYRDKFLELAITNNIGVRR